MARRSFASAVCIRKSARRNNSLCFVRLIDRHCKAALAQRGAGRLGEPARRSDQFSNGRPMITLRLRSCLRGGASLASSFIDHKLRQRTDAAIALSSGVAGIVERRKLLGDWSGAPGSSWRSTLTRFGGGEMGGADAAERNSLDDNIFQQTEIRLRLLRDNPAPSHILDHALPFGPLSA
jgi:hypothetical protein